MQIDIAAPRAAVLDALNTHDGLTSWWTTGVDREGDVLLFDFPGVPEPFRLRRERRFCCEENPILGILEKET